MGGTCITCWRVFVRVVPTCVRLSRRSRARGSASVPPHHPTTIGRGEYLARNFLQRSRGWNAWYLVGTIGSPASPNLIGFEQGPRRPDFIPELHGPQRVPVPASVVTRGQVCHRLVAQQHLQEGQIRDVFAEHAKAYGER